MDTDAAAIPDPVWGMDVPVPFVLERAADRLRGVTRVDAVAFCLLVDDLRVVVATDDAVASLEAQHQRSDGPGAEAARSGTRVSCGDLASDSRWPQYSRTAIGSGLRGCAALPVRVNDEPVGAVILHRREAGDWDRDTLAVAEMVSDAAGDYLAAVRACAQAETLAAQLQHALDSRIVIEQAKGIVAERYEVDIDTAFKTIRRHARTTGTRLHDVCADIVEGRPVPKHSRATAS